MRIQHDESGHVLVLASLSMTVLLGFTGLAADVGMLFHAKRNLQIAADAAASAGAVDYLYNGSTTSAQTAGKAAASLNGVTDGSGGAIVTLNVPASSGPNSGSAGFVEAIVSTPNPTFFMKLFNQGSVTVSARAVAGAPTAGGPCIWLMSKTGTGLKLKGAYDIEATDCGIYVNSTSSGAISVTGNGGIMNSEFVDVVGNATGNHTTAPTAPTLNAAPRSEPLHPPDPNPLTGSGCASVDSSSTTLTGSIAGPGLGSAICYTKAITLNGATLGPGTYAFGNGVTINGTVTANGATIDIADGTYNQPSNTTINYTASTTVSNPYNGISLMVPSTNSSYPCNSSNPTQLQLVFGSSSSLDGIIYAPCAQVFLQDNGGNITAIGIVADSMYDNASLITIPNYSVVHPDTSPFRVVTLVE
ncbi:hypothetical protein H7849_12290 [Alloacidobacterium dinghuense]|uniref:Putative Flp pilus-assembly TadG-like N-terminal domain-containing protein n=1 Tax=Alloacidobacterium dinghuense TaxID=2763107 RepID=A0A7G8BPY1_9BACT|nr:pilus assembly protein TadG-related protein [Alloacidobacterium dinghuense]QNI34601.1 hypothetical protein H7849_12290 [Alloacidobacterium dinghuense]